MKKSVLLFLGIIAGLLPLAAQTGTAVTGTITEEATGEPIPGATVVIKGTRTGVMADSKGVYRISAAPGATLVFSCYGYVDKEEAVGRRTVVDAVLKTDSFVLDEVIAVG